MYKKVLITGCKGQVGSELSALTKAAGLTVFEYDYPSMDILKREAVFETIQRIKPDIVVNCAAYTAVDKAENEIDIAMTINADGPANLAAASAQAKIPLIHISTDYVFDGKKSSPYLEDDPKNPLGIYGQSKSKGEELVIRYNPLHLILRTSWVFSRYGHNFVKTIVRLSEERDLLKIVADQRGCPTSAREIARAILMIMAQGVEGKSGIYNFCQPQPVTWYDFTIEIIRQARLLGYNVKCSEIQPIKTSEYPTPAVRPQNSVLNCDKIISEFNLKIPEWNGSLMDVLLEWKSGK